MSRLHFYLMLLLVLLVLSPVSAYAQGAPPQIVFNGGAQLQIANDQRLMLAAMQEVMRKNYRGAETLYSQAIATNPNNINAYVQRGMIRRELGDQDGTAFDGHAAVTLANNALQNNPNSPDLYYQRGMGLRLLKDFDQAQQDIQTAIQRGGQPDWQIDLQAVELEKKAGTYQ